MNKDAPVWAAGSHCTPKSPALAGSSPQWKDKRRQLFAIRKSVILCGRPASLGPRTGKALVVAAAVCACVALAFATIELLDLGNYSAAWNAARLKLVLLPYLAAAVAFALVQVRSSTPRTWATQLEDELAHYEPLDRVAYGRLQRRLKEMEDPMYVPYYINEWLGVERSAIEAAASSRSQ